MTGALAWASLLLRSARRDGLRNAWLWIGPLLVAQQISDLDRRPWVLYIIPLFGMLFGNALLGRGVTPNGARLYATPALPLPVSARARVGGGLIAGTAVAAFVTLTALLAVQSVKALIDLGHGGPATFAADAVRGLRVAATCIMALLPTAALPAAAPLGRGAGWLEVMVFGLIGAGVYFDAPAMLGSLPALAVLSSLLCAIVVGIAPMLERHAWRARVPFRQARPSTVRADRSVGILGAPVRTPARALLELHASTGVTTTLALLLPVVGLALAVFFLSGDPQVVPFLLPMVLTLVAAAIPTLPLATGPSGLMGLDIRPALWLPVRPQTIWWTSLAAACGQMGIALAMAVAGTAALTLVVPSVSPAEAVGRILASAPLSVAAVLLLRAGLYLGPLMPLWARVGCLAFGSIAALGTPVDIGLPRDLLGAERLVMAVTFLGATTVALIALMPRRARAA
jgi:hypothetical protein